MTNISLWQASQTRICTYHKIWHPAPFTPTKTTCRQTPDHNGKKSTRATMLQTAVTLHKWDTRITKQTIQTLTMNTLNNETVKNKWWISHHRISGMKKWNTYVAILHQTRWFTHTCKIQCIGVRLQQKALIRLRISSAHGWCTHTHAKSTHRSMITTKAFIRLRISNAHGNTKQTCAQHQEKKCQRTAIWRNCPMCSIHGGPISVSIR